MYYSYPTSGWWENPLWSSYFLMLFQLHREEFFSLSHCIPPLCLYCIWEPTSSFSKTESSLLNPIAQYLSSECVTPLNYLPSLGHVHYSHEQILFSMLQQYSSSRQIIKGKGNEWWISECQAGYWIFIVEIGVDNSAERHTHLMVKLCA